VSRHEVARSGGVHFLKNQTISELVTDRYPQIQWEKDKFIDDHQRKPHGYWKRKRHLLDALENAEIQMGILKVHNDNFKLQTRIKSDHLGAKSRMNGIQFN